MIGFRLRGRLTWRKSLSLRLCPATRRPLLPLVLA